MKITVTMDLTSENLDKLRALLPDAQVSSQPAEFDSPSESAVEQQQPEVKSDPAPESREEQKITKTDIRTVALKLSKAGKQKELAAIFAKFGAKKLSDFDDRPGDYPALMKELVSANG